ncbi:MAG: ribonuclease E/G [Actinobacteria bacterium]|nr:ribonuclease E/G [Actinomycetota bacterium]
MTDRSDDPTSTDTPTTDDTSSADAGRTRTRTRSRKAVGGASTRRSPRDADADAGGDAGNDDRSHEDTGDGSRADDGDGDDEGGSGGRRRGRRGRRGGRGGRGRGGGGGRGGDGAKGRSGDDGGEDAPATGEEETEEAIARGGTRMAAKRGGRSGGSSRGGRSGGRDQRQAGVSEEVRRALLDGPPRTMLVTSQEDRTQIAVLEDRTVAEHYVTRKEDVTYVGNIYMARVQNVLPGMEAAFLDIGKGRNGVLYAGEVLYDELDVEEAGENPRIQDALKQGQKVLVQVTKDPMGTKGPRLTMHLSLAGRYMVLAPNSDLFGISRKLTDKERDRLRKVVKKVKPDHHGVIVRTAAENATEEQLIADLERLLRKWEKVEERAEGAKALTTVYEEPPLVVKVIRDNFGPEFERCVVDSEELHAQVRDYLEEVAPELLDKVELYGAPGSGPVGDGDDGDDGDAGEATDEGEATSKKKKKGKATSTKAKPAPPAADDGERAPLFDAYNVNEQLRKAMGRKVWLPSGGYLIIEATEAMKVIDVNTGKFTGDAKSNLEEVVLKTNLEAAEEIVRQLRLRDLGGIIIIDFIDMLLKSNQDQVVRRLKRELLRDRTKTRVSEVSRLGLVQMTRKNVSQGLVEVFSHRCEECEGRGYISDLGE